MSIISRIKEVARNKGLTISDVEKACNLGENSIYKWDRSSPSLDKVMRVANKIDASIDYLATGENPSINALSDRDKELLKWLHMLDEEMQQDIFSSIRLYAKLRKEDLLKADPISDAQESQKERMISSK